MISYVLKSEEEQPNYCWFSAPDDILARRYAKMTLEYLKLTPEKWKLYRGRLMDLQPDNLVKMDAA